MSAPEDTQSGDARVGAVEEVRARVEDLEQEIAATLNRVAVCVDAVRTDNADLRYLVVERLPRLGTAVSAPTARARSAQSMPTAGDRAN
jgi:hypothetical protein